MKKTLNRIATAFVLFGLLISVPASASDPLAFTEAECRQELAVKLWELEQWRKPIKGLVREYLSSCPAEDTVTSLTLLREDMVNYVYEVLPYMKPKHFDEQADGVPKLLIDELIEQFEGDS